MTDDQLLQAMFDGHHNDGRLLNDLLNRFAAGYPIVHVLQLLRSEDENVAESGSWMAAELGVGLKPIFKDVAEFLFHSRGSVRAYVVDCLVVCADLTDGRALGRGADLILDPDPVVCNSSIDFLCRASTSQLRAAVEHTRAHEASIGLQWLLGPGAVTATEVIARFEAEAATERRFALVAAVKLFPRDVSALERASECANEEMRRRADVWLQLFAV